MLFVERHLDKGKLADLLHAVVASAFAIRERHLEQREVGRW